MKKFLYYFASTGWALGALVHFLSLAGIDIAETIPFVWVLHIGIFVVFIPMVIDLNKNTELQEYQKSGLMNRMNPIGFLKIIFKETPRWMAVLAGLGFFYAAFNFIHFMSTHMGTPGISEGQFVLEDHGRLLKILTEQEYHRYRANEIRGFSGHWIVFYGLSAAYMYKYRGSNESPIEQDLNEN